MPYDHDLLIIQVDLFLFIMAQRHKQLFNVERLTAMKIFFSRGSAGAPPMQNMRRTQGSKNHKNQACEKSS